MEPVEGEMGIMTRSTVPATERARRERGQGSTEWVGRALLAGVVLAALFLTVNSSSVAPQITRAWCLITSAGPTNSCPAAPPEKPIDELLPSCDVAQTDLKAEAEVTVFSVNLGVNGKATITQVKLPDGTTKFRVTFNGGGKLGAHAMLGEKALGQGLSAEGKAAFIANGAITYQFDNQEQASQFVRDMAKEAAKYAAAQATGIAAPVTKWLLDKILGELKTPPPYEYYVEAGTEMSVEGSASAGLGGKLSAKGAQVLGYKVTPATSSKPEQQTYYVKMTRELALQLGLGAGSGQLEGVVGITYEDGKPVKASVQVAGDLKAGLFGKEKGSQIPLPSNNTGTPSLSGKDQGVIKGKATLELDLRNDDNMNAFADALQSTGLPILDGYGTSGYQDPVQAMKNLGDRFLNGGPREGATLTTQVWAGTSSDLGLSVFAGDIIAFGAGGKISGQQLQSVGAWYYDPAVGGMVQWKRCGG